MELGIGTILLAEPFLQNGIFSRSVVLLCHFDEEDGAFGLILNKRIPNPIEDEDHPLAKMPFFAGGPMEPETLFFIHPNPEISDANPIQEGIFWQGKYEDLLEILKEENLILRNYRLFMGYAGWESGQLESELAQEDWIVYNGCVSKVLNYPAETMWREILRELGPYYRMISNFPLDPGLN